MEAKKCLGGDCPILKLRSEYSPHTYQNQGLIKVVAQKVYQEEYYTAYTIACSKCGKEFSVTEDVGYHFPTYQYPSRTD